MAKHKMYRRRCYISGYIKKQQNFLKFYKKSIDFKDMLWYHNPKFDSLKAQTIGITGLSLN